MIVAILFLPSPPSWIFTLGVSVSGLLLLMVGCYVSFSRRIYAHWQISLWQHGFIYERKQICQAFRWDQIENIQKEARGSLKVVYGCKVRRRDGYEVKIVALLDLPELIDTILEEALRHFAPQDLNIVSPSNADVFTALELDQQGITSGQKKLSWQEMQNIILKDGTIIIHSMKP